MLSRFFWTGEMPLRRICAEKLDGGPLMVHPVNEPAEIWMFQKIGVPQNGWFIMENPIKLDDLGGTIIFGNTHI